MLELFTWENIAALLTLTMLEIVLGIDNIVFVALVAGKAPPEQRERVRQVGLLLAMGMRILLLLTLSFIMGLTKPLFEIHQFDVTVTWKGLILIAGGLFLMWKSTHEIHQRMEESQDEEFHPGPRSKAGAAPTFGSLVRQILLIDIVFSIDSVVTAVGMARNISIMILAIVISVAIMLLAAKKVSAIIDRHPTLKMLALSFLMLIGVALVMEGVEKPIPKGYIYFAMAFSIGVEFLNLRTGGRSDAKAAE